MKNLKENSICIYHTISVIWPQMGDQEETLDMSDVRSKFNGAFCTNNSTICYVTDDGVFVTPYTRKAMSAILCAGLVHKHFYVPFSNGDYPKFEKAKWLHLRDMARESYYRDYEDDCREWCDKNGVGELSEEILANCFRMPREGVPVKHLYFEDTFYPACNEWSVDCTVVDKLGRFCTNNGKVVFIYRDGHTYVTKGYQIISALCAAGYKEAGIFVPFSNGETITNPSLAVQWERICK